MGDRWPQEREKIRWENYPLSKDSIVFDVGGYRGDWSQKIIEKYNPYIYIFEPVPEFSAVIKKRFKRNPKVSVFTIGLFDKSMVHQMTVFRDSSSMYDKGDHRSRGPKITVKLVDIHEFLIEKGITEIDLIKINIEGGEYRLLQRMIDKRIVEKCHDIQIQFHSSYPNSAELRDQIRRSLQETHFTTYDYPFKWENWRRFAVGLTALDLTKTSGCLKRDEVGTLKEIVRALPPNPVIVNIGTGQRGISCLAMLEERSDAVIFTVDVGKCDHAFENLHKSGREWRRVIQVFGESVAVGEHWLLESDAVVVDGDHHYEAVCEDIRVWAKTIKPGGVIIFHDHSPPEPRPQTRTQLQKEAWVTKAVNDSLDDEWEVVAHAGRFKAFRKGD